MGIELGIIVGSLLLVLVNLFYYFRSKHVLYGGFSLFWGLILLHGVLVFLLPSATRFQWSHLLDTLPGIASFVMLGTAFLVRKGTIPIRIGYIIAAIIVLQVILEIDSPQLLVLDLLLPIVSAGALFSSGLLLTSEGGENVRIEPLLIRGVILIWAMLLFVNLIHLGSPDDQLYTLLLGLYPPVQIAAGFLLMTVVITGEANRHEMGFSPRAMDELTTAILVVVQDELSGDGIIRHTNQLAADLYGYTRDEITGMRFGQLWGDTGPALDIRTIHGGFEATHLHKNRHLIHVRIHTSKLEQDGETFFAMIVTDETALTRYKRNLIHQEEQYHRLFTSIDDAMVVSQGMDFRLVNPAMERLVGEPEGSLKTFDDLFQFVDEPTREAMKGRLKKWALGEEVDEYFEFKASRTDGREADLELQSFRVPWFNNEPALVTIVRDIERHKSQERERQKMYETRLQAEQLQSQWLSLTLETSRLTSIGVIAAEITHEINQPMNAITLAADGIGHWAAQNPHLFPEFAQKLLSNIGSGTKRVSDILDHLNRLYKPLDQYTIEPLDLRSILRSCIRLIDGQANSLDTTIKFQPPEWNCMVNADAVQLEQLFANLMLISVNKLSKADVKERNLVVTILEEDGDLKISIVDNGSNLYTLENTLSVESYMRSGDTDPGDSVRLTVVRHLVERFNGTIHSRQNELGGTTMSVLFPSTLPDKTGGHA
ncbi:PAS domain S-box protein [bacterium]|nr:PAS domain S-box protein [bacterium]